VEVAVKVLAQTGEIRFVLRVHNAGDAPVRDIMFPFISGWTGIGGKGQDRMILGAGSSFDPFSLPRNVGTTYALWHQKEKRAYPLDLYAPWIDLSGPGGGISYILYNTQPKNFYCFMENLAGYQRGPLRLSWGVIFPAVVDPGETWETPAIGISVHGGDWRATADRYRAWMKSWFVPPSPKKDLRQAIGYQNVYLRGFEGRPFHSIEQIPALAQAGRKFGVNHLSLWDCAPYCGAVAAQTPPPYFDYSPEERNALAAVLPRVKQEGTTVSAIMNFLSYRPGNPSTMLTMEYTHDEVLKDYIGSARLERFGLAPVLAHRHWIGWNSNYLLTPFAPTLRAWVLKEIREYLQLGFVSLFWDQPFSHFVDYGHRGSGHRPEDTHAAVVSLIREARQVMEQNDPRAYILGQNCEVFSSQYVDMWMLMPPENLEHIARVAYALPHTMLSWVVDHDPAGATRAFAVGAYLALCTHGMEGTLADEPAFAGHVAKLAALRARCANRTVHARFNWTGGIDARGSEGLLACSYDGAEGPAVIVAAPGCAGKMTVAVERGAFSAPGSQKGTIHYLDGSSQECSGDCRSFDLKENDVAVWAL
jgi:hypothetical protein